jgi:hypothetical protein
LELNRPVAYLVDVVPFDGPEFRYGWVIERFGTNTLLHRRKMRRTGSRLAQQGRYLINSAIAEYFQSLPPLADWVWWRVDVENQNCFARGKHARRHLSLALYIETKSGETPAINLDGLTASFWGLLVPRLVPRRVGGPTGPGLP